MRGPTNYTTLAKMPPDAAAAIMATKPGRCPPLVLESPHEAMQLLHEDWTRVRGSWNDPEARERLQLGRPVWYPSSGNSMWPLVQSGDYCTFHPVQAVTAEGEGYAFTKDASIIKKGDVVFCVVQDSGQPGNTGTCVC